MKIRSKLKAKLIEAYKKMGKEELKLLGESEQASNEVKILDEIK